MLLDLALTTSFVRPDLAPRSTRSQAWYARIEARQLARGDMVRPPTRTHTDTHSRLQ